MSYMFQYVGYSATTWNIGNISSWNTSSVTDMRYMFSYAGYKAATFNLDLSSWNTSKVTNMCNMFENAGYKATEFNLDLSNWNTSGVTNMQNMFCYAGYSATTWSIGDISSWNTSSVTNMSSMFYCAGYSATTWNNIGTLKVYATNISSIFNTCKNAKATLNIYSNPTTYTNAFTYAATLSGSGIVVNYQNTTTNIDSIIATKSSNSNVTKGTQLQ